MTSLFIRKVLPNHCDVSHSFSSTNWYSSSFSTSSVISAQKESESQIAQISDASDSGEESIPHIDNKIIHLLNQSNFTNQDLAKLLTILCCDKTAGSSMGSHKRSTIWVCCQHSNCLYRRAVIPPLLIKHGANVNGQADNGFTPLLSLYYSWTRKKQEHKRQMALVLVHQCGATIPYDDARGNPIGIRAWLQNAPMNFQLLE